MISKSDENRLLIELVGQKYGLLALPLQQSTHVNRDQPKNIYFTLI